VAYSDSDWARCPETQRSTDCVYINIGSSVLQVGCQTQPGLPATSSSDPELRGMSRAARELYFMAQLATIDFAIPVQLPSLFADSSVGLAISRKLGPGNKLRHLEVCYFIVQEMMRRKLIKTYKCKGTANPANFLTKHAASPAAVQEALPALGIISLNEVSLQAALRDARLVKVSAFRRLIAPWKPRRAAATALQLNCIAAALSKAAAATNDYEGDDSFWLYVFTALTVGLTYLFWSVSRTQQKLQETLQQLQQLQQQQQQQQQQQTEPKSTPAAAPVAAPAAATGASETAATVACAPTKLYATTPASEAKTLNDRATDTRASPAARLSRARRLWLYAVSSVIRQLRRHRQWSTYGTFLQKTSQNNMWSGLTRVSGQFRRTKPSASWK
jgi:hypothetical protein